MDASQPTAIETAEVVLPCSDLSETLAFWRERLGFLLVTIYPADDPAVAVLSGHGLRLRLEKGADLPPGRLRLACDDPAVFGPSPLTAPNGTVIDLVEAHPPLEIPPLQESLVVQRMGTDAPWIVGRAGMEYRDLIPDRLGGRFIASHIRIPDGGPVPDNVHFHKIRFQMIFNYKGWVRLVYEDQGPEFVMEAGDCVLQPPEIRHRVLESSGGLEVIEIGCPAEHLTMLDHELDLPTGRDDPDRDFGGQRFVRHIARETPWVPWRQDGWEARPIGIAGATDGLAGVNVIRPAGAIETAPCTHGGEFLFLFVLEGGVTLNADGEDGAALTAGDTMVIPSGLRHSLTDASGDLEILEVTLPADFGSVCQPA